MSYITGVGLTPFGKHPGRSTLDLMSEAATAALADAQLERRDVDGLLCGYSTTFPHLMLSTVFVEHYGLEPHLRARHAARRGHRVRHGRCWHIIWRKPAWRATSWWWPARTG